MVFIRGRHPDASMSQYFRGGADGFVFDERDGICEARISANADRTVELFLALAEHLPPAVDVEIIDVPDGQHSFDIADHTDESRAAVRRAVAWVRERQAV